MFKLDDVVWDVIFGKGRVVSVSGSHSHALDGYPIVVSLDAKTSTGFSQFLIYDEDGFTKGGINRSLYFSEPVITGDCSPPWNRAFVDGELYIARAKNFSETAYALIVTGESQQTVFGYVPPSKANTMNFGKESWNFYKPGEEVEIE